MQNNEPYALETRYGGWAGGVFFSREHKDSMNDAIRGQRQLADQSSAAAGWNGSPTASPPFHVMHMMSLDQAQHKRTTCAAGAVVATRLPRPPDTPRSSSWPRADMCTWKKYFLSVSDGRRHTVGCRRTSPTHWRHAAEDGQAEFFFPRAQRLDE